MAAKTLEDAFNGLLRYWDLFPTSGSRSQLLSLAVQQGFVEPLLNEWLDSFLAGFVTVGFLTSGNYDLDLEPRRLQVGPVVAKQAATSVFEYLTTTGRPLDAIRIENTVSLLSGVISGLQSDRALVVSGRAWIVANAPAGAVKVATLSGIDFAIAAQDRKIASTQAEQTKLASLLS